MATLATQQPQVIGPHRVVILDDFLPEYDANHLLTAIGRMPESEWWQYINPFEYKKVMHRETVDDNPELAGVFDTMNGLYKEASVAFNINNTPLTMDTDHRYQSLFEYPYGGRLSVHVDAGVHPHTRYYKVITCLLYIGGDYNSKDGGELELWDGGLCTNLDPYLIGNKPLLSIPTIHNRLVVFENNDRAWHGINTFQGRGVPRRVFTVSFMVAINNSYNNRRQHAFFVPRPWEQWDADTTALRDLRADPKTAGDIYRVNQ